MKAKTLFDSDITLEEAQVLIKNGADLNEKDNIGCTPLLYIMNSRTEKNIEIAKLFINHGADVNAKNKYGSSLFFYADDLLMVDLLIAHGADVNAKDNDLNSPLHVSDLKKTRLLISYGADINQRNRYGDTPFDLAKYAEIATYLIEHGGIAGKIDSYIENKHFFSDEQQKAFDMFITITNNDDDFFQMCLAYQEGHKNNINIGITDIDLI